QPAGRLRHSCAHPVISLHTLCRPAAAVEEQDDRAIFVARLHGGLVGEIQPDRNLRVLIVYFCTQFLPEDLNAIQLLQIRDATCRLHVDAAVGKDLQERLYRGIHLTSSPQPHTASLPHRTVSPRSAPPLPTPSGRSYHPAPRTSYNPPGAGAR